MPSPSTSPDVTAPSPMHLATDGAPTQADAPAPSGPFTFSISSVWRSLKTEAASFLRAANAQPDFEAPAELGKRARQGDGLAEMLDGRSEKQQITGEEQRRDPKRRKKDSETEEGQSENLIAG